MTLEELDSLIDKRDFVKVFRLLDQFYEELPQQSSYNRLKKEFVNNQTSLDYEERLKVFTSQKQIHNLIAKIDFHVSEQATVLIDKNNTQVKLKWYLLGIAALITALYLFAKPFLEGVGKEEIRVEKPSNSALNSKPLIVTYPNGGQSLKHGQKITITWLSNNFSDDISLELVLGQGTTKYYLIADRIANTGSFLWRVPNNLPNGEYRIKLYNTQTELVGGFYNDYSDDIFYVTN